MSEVVLNRVGTLLPFPFGTVIRAHRTGGVNLSILFSNATHPRLRFSATLGEEPEIDVSWSSG